LKLIEDSYGEVEINDSQKGLDKETLLKKRDIKKKIKEAREE